VKLTGPDRDDLLGEFLTDENGLFQVSGATKEEGDIEVIIIKLCQNKSSTFFHISLKGILTSEYPLS
jgi:hypothetical protein